MSQHYPDVTNYGRAAEELHAAIMAIAEPELTRFHASRSTVLAQRATIAELQALVAKLAQEPPPASAWLRSMSIEERQALNVQIAAGLGSGGSVVTGIVAIGDRVLQWLADRLDRRQAAELEPKTRLAA